MAQELLRVPVSKRRRSALRAPSEFEVRRADEHEADGATATFAYFHLVTELTNSARMLGTDNKEARQWRANLLMGLGRVELPTSRLSGDSKGRVLPTSDRLTH